jgi:two-component system response regulator
MVKSSPEFSAIPVVVLSTSASSQDLLRAYACNANSYLVKPDDFGLLDALIEEVGQYWLELNRVPVEHRTG